MVESEPVKGQSQQLSDYCHRSKALYKGACRQVQIDSQVVKSSDKLIVLGENIDES